MTIENNSTVEKGRLLERRVGKILERMGCTVQYDTKLSDYHHIPHEVDIYAKANEAYGEIRIAVECKSHSSPVGIEDIRNFITKLNSLGSLKGIFVSLNGLSQDARNFAAAHGVETWSAEELSDLEKGEIDARKTSLVAPSGGDEKAWITAHVSFLDAQSLTAELDIVSRNGAPVSRISKIGIRKEALGKVVSLLSENCALQIARGEIVDSKALAGTESTSNGKIHDELEAFAGTKQLREDAFHVFRALAQKNDGGHVSEEDFFVELGKIQKNGYPVYSWALRERVLQDMYRSGVIYETRAHYYKKA